MRHGSKAADGLDPCEVTPSADGHLPFQRALLPAPAGDDMPELVTHLDKRDPAARERQARSRDVRAFLDAGVRLVEQQMVESDAFDAERGLLRFISRRAVISEARRTAPDLVLTEGKYRDKWRYHSDYVADLIAYLLAARHWSLHVSESWSAHELLTGEYDFIDAVHEIAYQDLRAVIEFPIYRFQLVAAATAARDEVVREALRSMYETITASWSDLYVDVLAARGVSLRPGLTIRHLTDMLSAVAEGLGLHLVADPDAEIIDHAGHTSLLGTAALALFIACVDPGDGHTLEDAVRTMLRYQTPIRHAGRGVRAASDIIGHVQHRRSEPKQGPRRP